MDADHTHHLWYSEPLGDNRLPVIVWCSVCGAYSTQKLRSLLKPCEKRHYLSAGTLFRKLQQGWHPQGRYQLQAPVRFKGDLLKSFHQFAEDRREVLGIMHKAENIGGSQEWTDALGLSSQGSGKSDPDGPEEQLSVFIPGADFDPAEGNDMDTFVWGFGLEEE